jgi:hypothetical protein
MGSSPGAHIDKRTLSRFPQDEKVNAPDIGWCIGMMFLEPTDRGGVGRVEQIPETSTERQAQHRYHLRETTLGRQDMTEDRVAVTELMDVCPSDVAE